MKITIQFNETKRITLFFPTRLIRSRLVWKMILQHTEETNHLQSIYTVMRPLYRYLKDYVKQNGHFTLVEAKTVSGCYVLVRI